MSTPENSTGKEGKEPPAPISRLPFLFFSRRWWWATLLVIAGMVVTFRLGIWQLDRLQQRRTDNAIYVEKISVPPLQLDGSPLEDNIEELKDRAAIAEGYFDFSEQIILVQQNYQGRPGGHLVAPFIIKDSSTAILVDRGWIPADE